MLKRQKNQVTVVLSVHEQKRLADVFILLIAIDKRVQSQKTRANPPSHNLCAEASAKEQCYGGQGAKKTKEYKSGSLKNSGPLFFYTPPWPPGPASPYSLFLIT